MKIYDTDREVYSRTTSINPDRTKGEIDGILARFGVRDVWWRYDIKHNDVILRFILPKERFDKELTVELEPPRIWHKHKKGDFINWKASMRNLYWYILTHLSQAYVMQSSKFTEFLPHILNREGKKLVDIITGEYFALPNVDVEEMKGVNP